MKNDPIESARARLDAIDIRTPSGQQEIAKALKSKFNLVAAKAARIAEASQQADLAPALAQAFERLLKAGANGDKGCAASIAIARALYALDYTDHELWLKGIVHVQKEPVWGGSIDTAAELRAVCAMGLAATRYPHKMHELVQLLADPEWQARAGSVRAIATTGLEAASLLLRLKALLGDEESEVIADCFAGLLELEGSDAVRFVASFADSAKEEVAETAILALGASRRLDAIEWLKQRYERTYTPQRRSILTSLAASRAEPAVEFVLSVIQAGIDQDSRFAIEAMKVNRDDEALQSRISEALRARQRAEDLAHTPADNGETSGD